MYIKKNFSHYIFRTYALLPWYLLLYAVTNSVYAGQVKDWTFVVYVAGDNDLKSFAARNIKQMAEVGSNEHINIIVELHTTIAENKKISRRYYIVKNKIYLVNPDDANLPGKDSGDPNTLISCCEWAINEYPANHYALIIWNHGTGPLDPVNGRIINPTKLFSFNPTLDKLELNRDIGFMDFIEQQNFIERGVCWDDTTGNYLSNQKLERALKTVTANYLNGKFDIIGFDTCLMAGIEIANLARAYGDILIGSQEVELGTGWNYQEVLAPFDRSTLTPEQFARNIVMAYQNTYNTITNDYTQSAINLNQVQALESNINTVAALLISCLQKDKNDSMKNAINASRNKRACTHFDEPSYLDLHHLYTNLIANLKYVTLNTQTPDLLNSLRTELQQGCNLVNQVAFANVAGKNLRLAKGISIYFPEKRMHFSYPNTKFAQTNQWSNFLQYFLSLKN
ncbi:MAG TPA: clostripain-related cysteine peptidase [Candidatus Babeliales bacterium]|nr:clostripain-related cysteine peptidase [Candidatus Babeliales bacterium]